MTDDSYATWTGHVIVCGLDGVSLRTIELLHRVRVEVVVIDDHPDDRLLQAIIALGIRHEHTSTHLSSTLKAAGIEGARAIICHQERDLAVIETALLARELAPQLRIVARVSNPVLGEALRAVTGRDGVLDIAGLAAPSIVEVCLDRSSHEIKLAGETFATAVDQVTEPGTLRSRYGDLAPVAVVPAQAAHGEVIMCPGRDQPVDVGDTVTLLATRDELNAAGLHVDAAPDPIDRQRHGLALRLKILRRTALSVAAESGRPLELVVVLLLMVTLASTGVFMSSYVTSTGGRPGFLNALYFTVQTIATVGYGDFSVLHQSAGLRVFDVVLILVGVTLVTALFALLTNLLVTRKLSQAFGTLRVPGMAGHVVVVGLGALGLRVVEQLLDEGIEVVIVERDEANRHLDRARALGVAIVLGDATQQEVLENANATRACGIAVLTSDDLTNIETGLAVRDVLGERWHKVPVAIRLFDHGLALSIERNFGFRHIRATSDLAAPWFVGAALGFKISATFSVGRRHLLVGSLAIADTGGLSGVAMGDLSQRTRVIALLHADQELEHPPRRQTVFRSGDEAFLVGPYDELVELLHREQQTTT